MVGQFIIELPCQWLWAQWTFHVQFTGALKHFFFVFNLVFLMLITLFGSSIFLQLGTDCCSNSYGKCSQPPTVAVAVEWQPRSW